jgi:hypothetical protein
MVVGRQASFGLSADYVAICGEFRVAVGHENEVAMACRLAVSDVFDAVIVYRPVVSDDRKAGTDFHDVVMPSHEAVSADHAMKITNHDTSREDGDVRRRINQYRCGSIHSASYRIGTVCNP